MSAHDPCQRDRLEQFINALLLPAFDGSGAYADTHKGVARALLASRHRWSPLGLAFLRWAACGGADSATDYVRLNKLLNHARQRAI
jgi:hypothetical protein